MVTADAVGDDGDGRFCGSAAKPGNNFEASIAHRKATGVHSPHRTPNMSSTLPAPSQQANKAALTAALAENPLTNTHTPSDNPDMEPGEIQEIDMHAQAEGIRTVFSDPTNFNVKVCLFHRAIPVLKLQANQHPLYSPWTLWFDSPATKGRNLPQTPISSFPQTPVLQTPSAAAAQGWMEDIKRVISFDSVEEFWGYALSVDRTHSSISSSHIVSTTISFPPHNFLKKPITIFSRHVPPNLIPEKS